MGRRLLTSFIDAQPLYWGRPHVQNMREIRGYPNWWRIRDDEAYIDGPPQEGEQYTKELFNWKVEIVKDGETGENTNKIELYNLVNTLEESINNVNGETVYSYKYTEVSPELSYEHTDVIDSVSLEFDQLGRRLIAFESAGDVFLIWYDPVPSTMVVTNWGAGYTPHIVTDTYRRTGGSDASTRFLFYIKASTKQIVYRKQLDRFEIEYQVPNAPADVVEILRVSKNIYGGLTVLYVYEDVSGDLVTGSFTARSNADQATLGTDGEIEAGASFSAKSGEVTAFDMAETLVTVNAASLATFNATGGSVTAFDVGTVQTILGNDLPPVPDITDTAIFAANSSTITFDVRDPQVIFTAEVDTSSFTATGETITFDLAETLVNFVAETETVSFTANSGSITSFDVA